MKLTRPCRHTQWFILAFGLAIALGLALLWALPTPLSAQNAATANAAAPAATAPELQCTSTPVRKDVPLAPDPLKGQFDPFEGQLDGPSLSAGLLPINMQPETPFFTPVCRVRKVPVRTGKRK